MSFPEAYFRAGVGMVVVGPTGKVLMIERAKIPGAFQFPQGGIKPGEPPELAARRELSEETGLDPDDLEAVGPLIAEWLAYELPDEYRSSKTGMGQVQKWFMYRYGSELLPDAPTAPKLDDQEASSFRWVDISDIGELAVAFRKPVYDRLAEELAKRIRSD